MDLKPHRKLLRSPSVKRKSKLVPVTQRVSLEKVLGLTVQCNAAFAVDSNTGLIAYPAGCVVVLYSTRKNKQSHIFNSSKKTITSLAFSGDGKHLVTGESGHQPCVRVWDVEEGVQVCEFKGHKFGINCVAFSPNLKYVVSIGTQHDMIVNVWNWRTNTKVASNKVSCKVNSVAFSEDGSMFVTVGSRHVKFWYLEASKSKIKTETVPLLGRSGILGEQKNNHFCDVACGKGEMAESTYAITQSGLLCEFDGKRLLDKWVELRTEKASSISVGEEYIFVGCGDGITRVFDAYSLHFVTTMPRPHYLGVDVATGLHPSDMIAPNDNAKHPDTIAVAFDDENKKTICIYNDHSLYVWDVRDVKKIGKAASFLYHSSCIWGLEIYPKVDDGHKSALPPGSFITCASDDTIRVWNLDQHVNTETAYRRNIYSNELLKIIYADPTLGFLCDFEFNPAGGNDKTDTNYDGKNGVRCIQVSPDGQQLASGDRQGNVRVHDLQCTGQLCQIEAHDSEVLCLQYSKSNNKDIPKLLASASRDRLLHIFDVEQNYGLLQTLDDHSSSITAVRFTDSAGQFQMLSCGADKSLLFRTAQQNPDFQFVLNHHLVSKTTLYDMDVDPTNKFVAVACQDRNVRIYNTRTGKQKKCYKGGQGDDGTLIKVQLDPTGSYAATSASDKSVSIYDFYTGECMASMYGHSEVVTGVKFTNDLKYLLTVSGDGCIFVWRLGSAFTHHMQSRLEDLGQIPKELPVQSIRRETYVTPPAAPKEENTKSWINPADETDFPIHNRSYSDPKPEIKDPFTIDNTHELHAPGYKFSVGQLPAWAKKQIGESTSPGNHNSTNSENHPRGRWAQRMDESFTVKSMLDESIHLSLSDSADKRRYASNSSPENERLALRRETVVIPKEQVKMNVPIIQDNDEMMDDDDDDEEFIPLTSCRDELEKKLSQDVTSKVTLSRGSDIFGSPVRKRTKSGDVASTSSFDDDDDDLDVEETEVIYYPSDEGSDLGDNPSTFQVHELPMDKDSSHQRRKVGVIQSANASNVTPGRDADSESLDAEEEEEMESNPGTPMDPEKGMFPTTPDKEQFLKNNFENLGASPDVAVNETFDNNLDALEQEMRNNPALAPHRLSLSSRFLNRAQTSRTSTVQYRKLDHQMAVPAAEVQKRKDEMAKVVDETRKRLQALGWKSEQKLDDNVPERDAPKSTSPPSKLENKENENFQVTQTSRQSGRNHAPEQSTARYLSSSENPTSPGMRRCWSMLDVSRKPLTKHDITKSPNRKSLGLELTSGSMLHRFSTSDNFAPKPGTRLSPPKENSYSGRSKSVQDLSNLNADGEPTTPTKKASKYRRQRSYEQQTTSSKAKTSRSSTGPALNKPEEITPGQASPKKTRKGRLSSSHRAQWQSTPSLVTTMEEEESENSRGIIAQTYTKSIRSEEKAVSRETSPNASGHTKPKERTRSNSPALCELNKPKSSANRKLRKSKSKDELCSSSDSLASIPSIASDSPRESKEREIVSTGADDALHIKKLSQDEKDKIYMPPPASLPLRIKNDNHGQHTVFLQRAAQSSKHKSKTPELTLSQAKDILMGKSSFLQTDDKQCSDDSLELKLGKQAVNPETYNKSKKSDLLIEDLDELPVKDSSPMKEALKNSDKGDNILENFRNNSSAFTCPTKVTIGVALNTDLNAATAMDPVQMETNLNKKSDLDNSNIEARKKSSEKDRKEKRGKNLELEDAKKKGLDTGAKLQELLNMANKMTELSFSASPPMSAHSQSSSRESSPRKHITPEPNQNHTEEKDIKTKSQTVVNNLSKTTEHSLPKQPSSVPSSESQMLVENSENTRTLSLQKSSSASDVRNNLDMPEKTDSKMSASMVNIQDFNNTSDSKASRNNLNLELTSKTVTNGPKQDLVRECQKVSQDLKDAVQCVTQLFSKLSSLGDGGNEIKSMMNDSLNSAVTSLKALQNPEITKNELSIAMPSVQDVPWMEPLLQQYSVELSDRICKMVQGKLEQK